MEYRTLNPKCNCTKCGAAFDAKEKYKDNTKLDVHTGTRTILSRFCEKCQSPMPLAGVGKEKPKGVFDTQ